MEPPLCSKAGNGALNGVGAGLVGVVNAPVSGSIELVSSYATISAVVTAPPARFAPPGALALWYILSCSNMFRSLRGKAAAANQSIPKPTIKIPRQGVRPGISHSFPETPLTPDLYLLAFGSLFLLN